jgi:hypothetical protein
MSKPVAGEAGRLAIAIRGINNPLFAALISNWALLFGVGVPMPTCACA